MQIGFLRLMDAALPGWFTASIPLDVAPPVGDFAGLTAVVVGALCCLVVAVIIAAALVIWLIKKKRTGRDTP